MRAAPPPPPPTILLTRPEAAARRFEAGLRAAGVAAPVVVAPLMRIVPDPGAVAAAGVGAAAALVFTSAEAVAVAAAASPARPPAFCVGPATAAAARAAGYRAIPGGGDVAALAATILAAPPAGPVLHLHGAHVRGNLARELAAAGLPARGVAVYEQRAQPLPAAGRRQLAAPGARVLAPVFSPRSAVLLAAALPPPPRAALEVVAISPAAAAAFGKEPPVAVQVAARPDAEAVIAALAGCLAAARRVEAPPGAG